jgi:hypothetical protein
MSQSNIVLNSPIVQSTLDAKCKPEVRYYRLESYHLLPDTTEAICKVRNLITGALRQVLASRLEPVFYAEDSCLLEFVRTGGQ